jgi:uncharacterized membrane protein
MMLRIGMAALIAAALAGIVHAASVLAMPQLAGQTAYQRLSAQVPVNAMVPLAEGQPGSTPLPFEDPAMVVAVCRYDVGTGAVRVHFPAAPTLASITFYTQRGVAFAALTEKAAARGTVDIELVAQGRAPRIAADGEGGSAGLRLEAPLPQGLIVVRYLALEPLMRPMLRGFAEQARCTPA